MDSNAATKVQSAILASLIIIAAIAGAFAYTLLSQQEPAETIKIGIFEDLDMTLGKQAWKGAILAAEHLNAEGGIIGRQVEVIGEDNDAESGMDMLTYTSALNRLLTYHKVDFIIGTGNEVGETVAEHKKIFIAGVWADEIEKMVLQDYNRYKYLFVHNWNTTSAVQGVTDSLQTLFENTDFRKVAFLAEEADWTRPYLQGLEATLPDRYDYEIVYKGTYAPEAVDFSSYFAQAEAAGAEILIPLTWGQTGLVVVKEWHDRQSPMVIYSGSLFMVSFPESWEWTDGKCEHVSVAQIPVAAEYPLTSKTLPLLDTYIKRWDETPGISAAFTYDIVRFILPDAIERAGTIDTNAVVEALEQTNVETSQARNFAFSSSHGMMMGENPNDPDEDYPVILIFQWQNGEMMPVHPKKIMEESGATYTFPDWPGPWD